MIFASHVIAVYMIANFIGPGFEPRTKQYDFFIGSGFNSQARSSVPGQYDPCPMSLFGHPKKITKEAVGVILRSLHDIMLYSIYSTHNKT